MMITTFSTHARHWWSLWYRNGVALPTRYGFCFDREVRSRTQKRKMTRKKLFHFLLAVFRLFNSLFVLLFARTRHCCILTLDSFSSITRMHKIIHWMIVCITFTYEVCIDVVARFTCGHVFVCVCEREWRTKVGAVTEQRIRIYHEQWTPASFVSFHMKSDTFVKACTFACTVPRYHCCRRSL